MDQPTVTIERLVTNWVELVTKSCAFLNEINKETDQVELGSEWMLSYQNQ